MRIVSTLILLFFIMNSFAQNISSEPLVDTTKQWNVHQYEYWNWDPSPEYLEYENTIAERFRGDTVIEDKHYAFLETCKNDSTFQNWQRTGIYFREDTISGQVFYYQYSKESLLFDFSLEVGDTLFSTTGANRIIDSVEVALVAGKERRVLHSTMYGGEWSMVEGFGSYGGLIDAIYTGLTGKTKYNTLMCYSENSEVLYQEGERCYVYKEYFAPIIDVSKQWNIKERHYLGCEGPLRYEKTVGQRFRGDTVIDDKHYSFLETCTNDSTFTNWQRSRFLFRENATRSKVYVYSNSKEDLIYDFTLEVGDTLKVLWHEYVVDSIGALKIGYSEKKVLYCNNDCGTYEFIEGMGGFHDLLEPMYFCNTGKGIWSELMCYSEYGAMCYREDDHCFVYKDYTNGVGENRLTNVSIYPNPVKNMVTIEMAAFQNNSHINVYTIDGKLVHKESLQHVKQDVDLSHLENGLLLITIQSAEGVMCSEQIILSK